MWQCMLIWVGGGFIVGGIIGGIVGYLLLTFLVGRGV